ncbi:MAG: BMP family ABC transporter substrate-binding protein [Acidimicrobiales bacterium]
MGRIRRVSTLLGASALVLGTLVVAATNTTVSAGAATGFKACMVTDTGGINDGSFNESAWDGMKDAEAANSNISIHYLPSTSDANYTPNINTLLKEGCGIIVTVGYDMDAATAKAANAHPSQKFAIVDDSPTTTSKDLLALRYETDQDAFLGGMLAAGMSTTGVVATYGGQNIPTVTLYMNGFVAGVRYYDKEYKAKVKVLGWKPAAGACSLTVCKGSGTFTNNFTDQTAGQTDTTAFFAEGADIVFPVAGNVGLGSVAAAKSAGAGHSVMWVDSNGCVQEKSDCSWFVGTVSKGIETSVKNAVVAAASGKFKGGTYLGTLKNDGVALEYGGIKVPSSLKSKITAAQKKIIAGTLSTNPNKYPAVS